LYAALIIDKGGLGVNDRASDYNFWGIPTTYHDGGYAVLIGGFDYQQIYRDSIESTGVREVPALNLQISMEWLSDAVIRGYVTVKQGSPINGAPSVPATPSGQTVLFANNLYTFSTTATDPEAQKLYYMWDFGDTTTEWIGPVYSDSIAETDHEWNQTGDYSIRVKSKDIFGLESAWSDPANVSVIVCGDSDGDNAVDIDDVVFLVQYIFASGPPPNPIYKGDSDCSGEVDIDDVVYLISYIFSGGGPPCDSNDDGEPDC
jgi:hypothetical protein